MLKKLQSIFKILIPIGLGVYLIFFIYHSLSSEEKTALFQALRTANYSWLIISVVCGILSHLLRAYRWQFQLNYMGYSPLIQNNFMAVMIGYFVNMALPRVGEASRAAALTRYEKVPFQKGFGSIIGERAVDLLILLSISIITVFMQYHLLKDFVEDFINAIRDKFAHLDLLVILLFLGFLVLVFWLVYRFLRSSLFFEKLMLFIHGLTEGLYSIFKMEKKWLYLFCSLGIWLLYLTMFWICFFTLESTSNLGASAIFAGFVLGSFAVVIVPGGIGAYPVAIMQSLLLYGIAREEGFALGWIIWSAQTIMIIVVGGISLLLMPVFNKKNLNGPTSSTVK